MRAVLLALTISLAACTREPIAPNRAIAFVTFAEPAAECLALDTGIKGLADTATCRIKGALFYCAGIAGSKPQCEPLLDQKAPHAPAEAPK